MIKTFFRDMRNRAVMDHRRCILACLEPSDREIALLDCGCDDGEWTLQAGARVGNARLYGIEIVEERRREAERKGIVARPGNLEEAFPFPDGFFDAVHANQVIEHLADTDRFIAEIRRTLKPGGYAVICTENLSGWHNIFSLVMGWQPFSLSNVSQKRFQIGNPLALHRDQGAESPKSWQHSRVFSYLGLREIFLVHGFDVERTLGSGYYPLPGLLGKLDPRHAAFLTLKVRKPAGETDGAAPK